MDIKSAAEDVQKEFDPLDGFQEPAAAGLQTLITCQFRFKAMHDVQNICAVMSLYFEKRKNVVTGISALMVNAIEHGNLGLGYEKKAELLESGEWRNEVDARLADPEYKDKHAELVLTKKPDGIYIIITDEGRGFENWEDYLEIDPVRSGRKHGRGIALANALSFDKLSYNDVGNQAIGYVSFEESLNW